MLLSPKNLQKKEASKQKTGKNAKNKMFFALDTAALAKFDKI